MNEMSLPSRARRAGPLWIGLLGSAVFTLAVAPASAQRLGPQRSSFAFIQDHLTITVRVEAPGVLRITRGSIGILGVAGRAVQGFTAAGLADPEQDHLNLTAVGADQVSYLVTVPAGVRVRVQLPDRRASATMGGYDEIATFRWDGSAAPPTLEPGPGLGSGESLRPTAPVKPGNHQGPRFQPVYAGADAPSLLSVPELGSIRKITVRWEGDMFRVLTERRAAFRRGDADAFGLRATGPPQDVVVVVPRDTDRFVLRLRGAPALILDRTTGAETFCQPIISQRLDDNRRWFTFTPHDGTLACRPPSVDDRRARRSTE